MTRNGELKPPISITSVRYKMNSGDTTLPILISENRAAQILNVCIDTLRRKRGRGHIGYIRLGRKIYYSELQLKEYLKCQTINPKTPPVIKNALKSEATGCQKGRPGVARHGIELGSTQARQTCRASLGTTDFSEAKLKLAEWVLNNSVMIDEKPEDTPLAVVLMRHLERTCLKSAFRRKHSIGFK